uniref:Uncharacterized protein n=1 Tax=Leishmania guyanensis TaxID=5670 RepID=A0A1E1IUG2_LEIGU|nr:Hypothetical protein BN36_2024340 [Leishmania guyanensis]
MLQCALAGWGVCYLRSIFFLFYLPFAGEAFALHVESRAAQHVTHRRVPFRCPGAHDVMQSTFFSCVLTPFPSYSSRVCLTLRGSFVAVVGVLWTPRNTKAQIRTDVHFPFAGHSLKRSRTAFYKLRWSAAHLLFSCE